MSFFDRLFKGKEVFADRRNPDNVSQGDTSVKAIVMTLPPVRMGGDGFELKR